VKAGNRARFVVTVITVALISEVCLAFDDGDFQYWSKTGVSFDINKDWRFTFEEEFKLGDDAERLYCYSSDFGFVYKSFADWIDLGFNFKQEFAKDNNGRWRQENRPHFNITFKGRLLDLDLSNRSRFEYRDRENKKDLWRYRNKVTVKLPVELTKFKIQPYLADEVFFNFDKVGYSRNRFYSGASFTLSKNIKGGIFYLWQASKSGGAWKDTHVLGTDLKFYF